MKKALGVIILVGGFLSGCSTTDENHLDEEINIPYEEMKEFENVWLGPIESVFPNPTLAGTIAAQLGYYDVTQEIYSEELLQIKSLNLDYRWLFGALEKEDFEDGRLADDHFLLNGMEYLRNLESLELTTHHFALSLNVVFGEDFEFNGESLQALKNLQNLEELRISGDLFNLETMPYLGNVKTLTLQHQRISCLSALTYLPNMSRLSLSHVEVVDLSSIAELKNLNHLWVSRATQLNDWNLLAQNPNLTRLDLVSSSPVMSPLAIDWSALSKNPNLTHLHIQQSNGREEDIIDWSYLSKIPNLSTLSLSQDHLDDVSYFASFPSLTALEFEFMTINDWSFLGDISNLASLSIKFMEMTDSSTLGYLQNLKNLDLDRSRINDFTFLLQLPALERLNLAHTEFNALHFLSGMTNLSDLNLWGNYLNTNDIALLEPLINLEILDLGSNQITDIYVLKNFKSLKELNLRGNQIFDLTPLSQLNYLTTLELRNNLITDVSPLTQLPQLKYLNIRNNNIIDISPLVELPNFENFEMLECLKPTSEIACYWE